jgi:hypothetical protein
MRVTSRRKKIYLKRGLSKAVSRNLSVSDATFSEVLSLPGREESARSNSEQRACVHQTSKARRECRRLYAQLRATQGCSARFDYYGADPPTDLELAVLGAQEIKVMLDSRHLVRHSP